jgi:hypothetical protein
MISLGEAEVPETFQIADSLIAFFSRADFSLPVPELTRVRGFALENADFEIF